MMDLHAALAQLVLQAEKDNKRSIPTRDFVKLLLQASVADPAWKEPQREAAH